MTWWNSSSSHGRHHSSSRASVSPTRFSSNHELFADADADPDWVGGQLEQARLQRSGFYQRLHSASRRGDDDVVALQKSRRISPDGVDDTASVSSVEPPHSSWRFYTSFDNGEWRRHAVPVFKAEEASTRNYATKSRESDVRKSACQAAESSLRRARHPRTTAADRQQARLRMRSGDSSMENSAYGRWKLSSSADTFRNTAAGGSLTDLRSVSPEAYHQSFNSLDVPQVLSPSSDRFSQWEPQVRSPSTDRFSQWLETTSPVGIPPRPRLDSYSSPPKTLLPVGSCVVDGIDVTFQEKFIIPTKYKNRENNTAAGTPETPSKTEVPRSTSAVLESGCSDEVSKKSVDGASVSCMTGQGEVQAVKSSEQKEVVLFGRVNSTRQETEERRVDMEPPEVTSVMGNGDLNLICDLKHDQFAIVSKFIQEKTFEEFSENCKLTTEKKEKFKVQTTYLTQNGSTDSTPNPLPTSEKKEIILEENQKPRLTQNGSTDSTPNPEPTSEKKEIILEEKQKPRVDDTLSSKTILKDAENTLESSSGRSLAGDVKRKQKTELTANMAASLVSADQKVSSNGDKIVKFVSTFYADINEDLNKETSNTKHKLSKFVASDTMVKSPEPVDTKVDPVVSSEEDDNWVVEIAVKN